jgi:hypothetical protein
MHYHARGLGAGARSALHAARLTGAVDFYFRAYARSIGAGAPALRKQHKPSNWLDFNVHSLCFILKKNTNG